MSKYRFFSPPEQFVHPDSVFLSDEESHHGLQVLRLRVGDSIQVFDGIGHEYQARVVSIQRKQIELALGNPLADLRESPLVLILAAAMLKGERFEWVIQKAVELGVTTLIPLITDHTEKSVVRQDSQARRARWERIALEATKQSGRRTLMAIQLPQTLEQVLTDFSSLARLAMLTERAGKSWQSLVKESSVPPASVVAVVGPEGGWSVAELDLAEAHQVGKITLGPRILRAETACIVAVSLLQLAWGDWRE
jgi:16S rRNA (uracil1498-N3)-methyltransferase